jgi:hypothetical protein
VRRPLALWVLMACTLLQGISGLAGGIKLVAAPGEGGWFPLEWLDGSPFGDYLIPGLILLVVLGVYPLLLFVLQWRGSSLAWWGSGALGVALVVWILVEILVAGSEPGVMRGLQIVYGSLGLVIVALSLTPAVRRHLRPEAAPVAQAT